MHRTSWVAFASALGALLAIAGCNSKPAPASNTLQVEQAAAPTTAAPAVTAAPTTTATTAQTATTKNPTKPKQPPNHGTWGEAKDDKHKNWIEIQ